MVVIVYEHTTVKSASRVAALKGKLQGLSTRRGVQHEVGKGRDDFRFAARAGVKKFEEIYWAVEELGLKVAGKVYVKGRSWAAHVTDG